MWDADTFHDSMRPSCVAVWGDPEKPVVALSPSRAQYAQRPTLEEMQFVPPEQLAGGNASGRGDICLFGVIVFKMLTGEYPFLGKDVETVRQSRLKRERRHVRDIVPELSPMFEELVQGLMAVAPKLRYPTPVQILRDLNVLTSGQPEEFALNSNEETAAVEMDVAPGAGAINVTRPTSAPTTFCSDGLNGRDSFDLRHYRVSSLSRAPVEPR